MFVLSIVYFTLLHATLTVAFFPRPGGGLRGLGGPRDRWAIQVYLQGDSLLKSNLQHHVSTHPSANG